MLQPVDINQVLSAEVLPSLPTIAIKILSLDADSSAETVSRVIAQDAALSARILKVANSPLYAPISPVGNVKRAIAILGNRQVRTLSLAFSLIPLENSLLDFRRFWEHSLAMAVGTRLMLKKVNPRLAEEGFTAGLLADIGMILLAGAQPAKYQDVLRGDLQQDKTVLEVEGEVFGFDHAALGSEAARRWNFPNHFLAVISHHHDPGTFQGDQDTLEFVQIVHLASVLADIFYSERIGVMQDKFYQVAEQIPVLKTLSFGEFIEEIGAETKEAANWMGIYLDHKRSLVEILEEANKRLVGISTEYEEAIEWVYRTQVGKIQLLQGN